MSEEAKYTSESQQQIQLVKKYPSVRTVFKTSQKFLVVAIICTILVFSIVVTPAQAKEAYISREADLPQMPIEQPYIRKEAHSPEAQEDIKSLKIALVKMKEMDCSNPLSWYYQGGIHWVPRNEEGKDDPMKYLEENPLCSSYTRSNDKLKEAWDNCTHSNSETSKSNFLVWHRFYVYHFENVVRVLSGNKNFAMPYWGYVSLDLSKKYDPSDIKLTMPEAFREPGNSLYEEARFSKLLKGEKIEENFAKKNLYKRVNDLRQKSDFRDFNNYINDYPHGAMHNYIGSGLLVKNHGSDDQVAEQDKFNKIFNNPKTNGLMAEVASAGFDPIFWMHHGNIDRLWDQWTNSENGKYVTLDNLRCNECDGKDWEYTFFDPEVKDDGTIGWKEVKYKLDDVIKKLYNLGYKYDDTDMVKPPVRANFSQPSPLPTPLASQEVGNIVDSSNPVNLELSLEPQIATEFMQLRTANSTEQVTKGFTLEIDVTYTGRPYSSYDVFLNLPDQESKSDIDTYFAGSISFFVLPSAEPVTKTFQFDITDELAIQLEKQGEEINNKLSVLIEKATGPEDESLKIERISLESY